MKIFCSYNPNNFKNKNLKKSFNQLFWINYNSNKIILDKKKFELYIIISLLEF